MDALKRLSEDPDMQKSLNEFESYVRVQMKTFANFPLRAGNYFAHAAAIEATRNPGFRNPLFLYGSNQDELMHLLTAIRNACPYLVPQPNVTMIAASRLQEHYCDLTKTDVLLMHGIHSLNTEEQYALSEVIRQLCGNNKQVVLTADRDPAKLGTELYFHEKLLARIASSGLTAGLDARIL